jgi:WASH complex subunit 7
VGNTYPYEKGVEMLRDIRRLGPKEGRTFMDQFRILLTEIGNALVRLDLPSLPV